MSVSYGPPKRRGAGRWLRLGLALLLVGLAMYKGISYTKKEAAERAQELVAKPSGQPPSRPGRMPSDWPTAEPTTVLGKVGQPVRIEGLEFTVLARPACSSAPVMRGVVRAKPERGQFCTVRVRVVNRGTVPAQWTAAFALVAHTTRSPGTALTPSADGMFAVAGGTGFVQVAPGASGEGSGVFDVATGDTLRDLELAASIGGQTAVVTF